VVESSENKLAAGPILGFVGGFVVLVYGTYEAYLGSISPPIASLGGIPVSNIAGVTDAGVAGIVLGVLMMALAVLLWERPGAHVGVGLLMILFSVLSLVSVGGGDGVGLILGVLGGTSGVVYGPGRRSPARGTDSNQSPSPPTGPVGGAHLVACHACGHLTPVASAECPECHSKIL
jgi:hypothetical protein